ncbi:MAG: abortive infection system antitoxin AbiGi family protein [Oscillospiraceae bacterium]|nr:abortive infection system antitoxin AbiGi family protein [Oscillospiraceae bacterium]
MRNGIQPVQYINKFSTQRKDFTEALNLARSATKYGDDVDNKLKSFILEQMLYYKPYAGKQYHRPDKEEKSRCFADECEWRYIPDVSKKGFVQVYYRATTQPEALERLNKAMNMDPDVSLKFEYDDIKYIVIKDKSDFDRLLKVIDGLKCDDEEKYKLFSKIIVWEEQRRDF